MEHLVDVSPGVRLWVEDRGSGTPLLLVMGANAGALAWPDALVDRLAVQHRVVRYDHRDTGRSTRAFDQRPYALRDLAGDAVAVLDALGIECAHVVGMSMGGVLVQLLLLDHPDRLLSATLLATAALGSGLADPSGTGAGLPGPDPDLFEYWGSMGDERTREDEIAWRVEHWRRLNGPVLPFDPAEFRAREEREIDHAGTHRGATAHARAGTVGLERGAELAAVSVPVLVLETPEDPVNPPPHAAHLEAVIGGARRVSVAGMGHALPAAVLGSVADAVLAHARRAEG